MASVNLDRLYRDRRKAETNGNWKEAAALCNYIGDELCKLGKFEEALLSHTEELELCTMLKDELGKAVANRKIGECYCELSRFKEALKHHKVFLNIAVDQDSAVEQQRAWATLGRTYYLRYLHESASGVDDMSSRNCLGKAEQSFLKALQLADTLKSQISAKEYAEMRARLLLNIGLVYVQRNVLTKCAASLCTAIFLTKKFQLYEDLYRCQFSLATVYQRCDKFNHALRLFDDSIATAKLLHDKTSQCESLVAKANVLLYLKDFEGVKTYLKKAYRLRSPVTADHEKTEKQLKVAISICYNDGLLQKTTDLAERKLLFEKIGDGLASLDCFKLAVQYYLSSLECLESMGVPPEDKAPIYYSLAQTYADDGNYEEALKYFKIEIQCNRSKPEEQIKTLWKIADIEEEDSNYAEAEKFHLEALKLSESIGKERDVACSLKKLRAFYSFCSEIKKPEEIERKLLQLDDKDDESSGEDYDITESDQLINEIDLDALSPGTDSDVEKEMGNTRRRRRTKHHEDKRNEMGETPLHRACISGSLKLVKHLIETGHPVNPRDNCGWLPLHEACNHGFYDIVEYLLDKGAWINDHGGKLCEGITPLHDAAACGNLEVVELLLSRGASATALNNHGETPLDSFMEWWHRSRRDLDSSSTQQCKEIEAKLKALMKQVGQSTEAKDLPSLSSEDIVLADDEMEDLSRNEKRIHSSSSSNTSEDEDGYQNPHLREEDDLNFLDHETVQSQYKAVISSFRRSAVSAVQEPEPHKPDPKPLAALLDEDEVVDQWLIQDTGRKPCKQKKKKQRKLQKLDVRKNCHSIDSYMREKYSDNESIPSPTGLGNDRANETNNIYSDSSNGPSTDQPVTNKVQNGTHMFCLRVQISDKIILVPVPDNESTVGWLGDEAARRFYDLMGSKPQLSLMNKDGALLSGTDLIKNVLQHNEKVSTNIECWDKTSPSERYGQYCKKNGVPVSDTIMNKFLAFETSLELDLSDFLVPCMQVTAVLTCLPHCATIRNLNFSQVDMDDIHVDELVKTIPAFVSLSSINLSCCGLTSKSVRKIAECLTNNQSSAPFLQKLRHLDVSYNDFGPGSSDSFADIVNVIPLETLNLSSCGVNESFFQNPRLCEALSSKATLIELNVSGNDLNTAGISKLLSCLPRGTLRKLDLANCVSERQVFVEYLGNFLSNSVPYLMELQLSGCYLHDSDLLHLSKDIRHCPRLSFFNLSANPGLSVNCLANLVQEIHRYNVPLSSLNVLGCFLWDEKSADDFIELIRYKCLSIILVDEVPALFEDAIFCAWKEVWGSKAVISNNVICELMINSIPS